MQPAPNTHKPIFTVGIPMSQASTPKALADTAETLRNQLTDYHILVYQTPLEQPVFEAFYEKDFKQDEFDRLKLMIVENFKKEK